MFKIEVLFQHFRHSVKSEKLKYKLKQICTPLIHEIIKNIRKTCFQNWIYKLPRLEKFSLIRSGHIHLYVKSSRFDPVYPRFGTGFFLFSALDYQRFLGLFFLASKKNFCTWLGFWGKTAFLQHFIFTDEFLKVFCEMLILWLG